MFQSEFADQYFNYQDSINMKYIPSESEFKGEIVGANKKKTLDDIEKKPIKLKNKE